MSYLISNIPFFRCLVRKEFTHNHEDYHGDFLHALAISVNTIPDRCLSFNVVFTGCEAENDEENLHGGAMWARMPITGLIADTQMEELPELMPTHFAQPWDCSSRHHSVIVMDRISSSPWLCKIGGEFYTGKYMFTVDYTDNEIADDPAQHKQSHVIELTDAGRVRVTNPAMWITGEGAPDFAPSQYVHSAEIHNSYMDPYTTFNNLYQQEDLEDAETYEEEDC
jgi:hypothetical protein